MTWCDACEALGGDGFHYDGCAYRLSEAGAYWLAILGAALAGPAATEAAARLAASAHPYHASRWEIADAIRKGENRDGT